MNFLKKFWTRLMGGDRPLNINTDAGGGPGLASWMPSQQDEKPE